MHRTIGGGRRGPGSNRSENEVDFALAASLKTTQVNRRGLLPESWTRYPPCMGPRGGRMEARESEGMKRKGVGDARAGACKGGSAGKSVAAIGSSHCSNPPLDTTGASCDGPPGPLAESRARMQWPDAIKFGPAMATTVRVEEAPTLGRIESTE
eukprot:1820683-Rhodomonas_salina.1